MSIQAFLSLTVALAIPAGLPRVQSRTGECFATVYPQIDSARSREDSLALGERLLKGHPGGAICGNLVAGYLLGLASTANEDDWRLRQRATDLLNAGLRGNESEPRLYFALGVLMYNRNSRTDAERMFGRAVDRVKNASPPLTPREEAHIHYIRGMMHQDLWRDYRSYGDIKTTFGGMFQCGKMAPDDGQFTSFFFLCPDEFDEIMPLAFTNLRDLRKKEYEKMEDAFRAALRADPSHEDAQRRLFEEYLYGAEYEKADDVVRLLLRQRPDDPVLIAVHGAVQHSIGRDSLAELSFQRALALMPDDTRKAYLDLNRLVTPTDSTRFAASDSGMRTNAEKGFWDSVDPIYLTPYNERRLEHFTRLTVVDLVFGAPTLGLRGWDTDAGQVWIRYGRPRRMYELNIPNGRDIFWVYEGNLRFFFTRNVTYRRYLFGSDLSIETSDRFKKVDPHRGSTRTMVHELVTLDRQIVRLYDKDYKWNVHLFAPRPPNFGPETRVGFTLLNADFAPLVRRESRLPGHIAVQLQTPPGRFAVALELWDRAYGRLGRVRDTVAVDSLGDGLAVSDILVATRIRSRGNRRPAGLADVEIVPAYGLTLTARQPIGFYWEIYGLTPDSAGAVRYEISLQVRRSGLDLPTRMVRGLMGRGPTGPTVQYAGSTTAPADRRTVEWLEIEGPASPGTYQVTITIQDRVSGATVVTTRSFLLRGSP